MLSVGEILKKAREKKGLTTKDIEKELKVRERFLLAIENDDWTIFSSKIYIGGLIKNYSKVVNLDPIKMLAFFRREYEKSDEVKFKRRVSSGYLTPETRKIIWWTLLVIVFFFISYFGYQLKLFLSPPALTIIQPTVSVFKHDDKIAVVGKTEKDASVSIFGQTIYHDKEGVFKYNFPLKMGKNTLIIEVVGANGKKTIVSRDYYREK